MMTDADLIKTAQEFRKGLLGSRTSRSMCFMVSAPLLSLLSLYGVSGQLDKAEVYRETKHACTMVQHWFIRLQDGRILDATADQFLTPTRNRMPPVYLGETPNWYEPIV